MTRSGAAYLSAILFLPFAAFGQTPISFFRQTSARWMNGRQQPAFTPMVDDEQYVRLDHIGQVFEFRFGRDFGKSGGARVATDPTGRILHIEAHFDNLGVRAPSLIVSPSEELRWEVFDGVQERILALPAARVWDLIPVVKNTSLHAQDHWTDTLNLTAAVESYRQTLHGIRSTTVLRDTLVDGTTLWIVRDSARVSYGEQFISQENSVDTPVVIRRSGRGVIVGRYLLDPRLRLFRWRVDTTHLAGEAELRYGGGRRLSTPARFDRISRIDMMDTTLRMALAHRRDSIAKGFSIVMRPEGNAERLAHGDTSAINAMLDTLARSHDPAVRARASRLVYWVRDTAATRRLRAIILTAGDTTATLDALGERWRFHRVDSSDVALELPLWANPRVAFAFGVDRNELYEGPRNGFLRSPPAITADTTRWPCTPAACRMVAAQWPRPVDQRLRDLALIARMTMEPKIWSDTVLVRWKAGDHFLDDAATLVRGVAASWPAGSQAEIPGPDAGWRAWSNWMDNGTRELVRFEAEHTVAIRFTQARTGRDFVAEWRRTMQQSSDDTTQMVFGAMRAALGDVPDTTMIVGHLRSTSSLLRTLGADEVVALLTHSPDIASPSIEAEIQDSVLAMAVDGAPVWPSMNGTTQGLEGALPRNVAKNVDRAYGAPYPAPGPLVVVGDSLANSVRSRWAQRGIRFVSRDFDVPTNESVVELYVSAVHAVGPFVRVTVNQSHLTARINGRGESWEGGGTVYLMRTDRGWQVVTAESWIT